MLFTQLPISLLSALTSILLIPPPTSATPSFSPQPENSYAGWGGGIYNNRWADSHDVTASKLPSLTRVCPGLSYQYGISATPVTVDSTVYYPTWNGSFYAVDFTTCKVQWSLNVTAIIYSYGPLDPQTLTACYVVSRTSPQIDGDILYFGTQAHALLVAVNRHTGAVLAKTQLNPHPLAVVTISPTVYNGVILAGTSSYEEPAPLYFANYPCCSYIGNTVALTFSRRTNTFTTKWDVPTLPANAGWSGAGVWGSQPAVDPGRNQVFFGTGNVYSFPPAFAHCANATADCLPPGVNQEAVIAIDISSGRVNWVRRLTAMDAWNGACITSPIDTANCPSLPPGSDADFGMAPSFVPKKTSGLGRDLLVVGQKNGVVYALSPSDGASVWMRSVRADMTVGGGISWGIAVDDKRVYYTLPYSRAGLAFNVSTTVFGASALGSGSTLWQTPATLGGNNIALTGPTVAGDLVLFPRTGTITGDGTGRDYMNSRGALVVLDKRTGAILKEMQLDTNFQGGIAVQGKYILFGTGYRVGSAFVGNGTLWVLKAGGR